MATPQPQYNRKKFLLVFALTVLLLAGLQALFHFDVAPLPEPHAQAESEARADSDTVPHYTEHAPLPGQFPELGDEAEDIRDMEDIGTDDTDTPAPTHTNVRRGAKVWSYHQCFPDLQDEQLASATKRGIVPADDRESLQTLVREHRLVDITASPFYVVDSLSHSLPYLVPDAYKMLNDIALHFQDSLRAKGLTPHLPVISSVTRTASDVARLQHGNSNATTNSCHCYGTTVDIAYHRFVPLTGHYPQGGPEPTRYDDDLKYVLAEVLYDMRAEGRCLVKYEYRQACFHLTLR